MCGLCGMFDSGRRWLDAAATLDPAAVRRERLRRVAIVRRVLAPMRVAVDDFEGASFVLRGPTGATEIVDNLSDLWRKAEALGRRRLDPLESSPVEFDHHSARPRESGDPLLDSRWSLPPTAIGNGNERGGSSELKSAPADRRSLRGE